MATAPTSTAEKPPVSAETALIETAKREPGIGAVLGTTLKSVLGLGAVVSVIAAAVAMGTAAALGEGGLAKVSSFLTNNNLFSFGSETLGKWGGVAASSAAIGATASLALSIPSGIAAGVSKVKKFYAEEAIPQVAQVSVERGIAIGAQMQQEADKLEMESFKQREAIAKRSPQYAAQLLAEGGPDVTGQAKGALNLATMEPAGRG